MGAQVTTTRDPGVPVGALETFAAAHVTVDSAPIARQSLLEDRVIEVDAETAARQLPESFHDLLAEEERHVLWTLGKIAALATSARHATFEQARASGLQERI